jgi:response regulator RpfG family c-di-GMP phosphodiesterase
MSESSHGYVPRDIEGFYQNGVAMKLGNNDRGKVLIVDDEKDIREILCDTLADEYDCVAVASAEEALAALDDQQVVISDIMMKGMSGLEMIPHVLEKSPDTVVLMISGESSIDSAISAMRHGAFDYLVKPFNIRQLAASVRRAFEHHDLLTAKRLYENHLELLVARRTGELDRALMSVEDSYRMTLKALAAALETRDHDTHGHSERVVAFSLRLGRELNLNREQLRSLEFGSLLHDIGKIGVADAILHKHAKLSEEEWVEMRQHPVMGGRILSGIEFLAGASRVVSQHHEMWNGTGYPLGLKEEEIDLNARIFAVADTLDAITSDRVYRAAQPYEAAAAELDRWAGEQFDPNVVAAFHRVPPEDWNELRASILSAVPLSTPMAAGSPVSEKPVRLDRSRGALQNFALSMGI